MANDRPALLRKSCGVTYPALRQLPGGREECAGLTLHPVPLVHNALVLTHEGRRSWATEFTGHKNILSSDSWLQKYYETHCKPVSRRKQRIVGLVKGRCVVT